MASKPLSVHCCRCRWSRRKTGPALALNALIESDRVPLLHGEIDVVDTPPASGRGQRTSRCPKCRVALQSRYGGGDAVRFVQVGTLAEPDRLPPDIHTHTASKQPWLVLPVGAAAVAECDQASA